MDNDGFETYRSTTYGGDVVRPERKSATGLHWWILRPSQLAQFEEGLHKLASPAGRFFLNDTLRSLATLKRSQGRCGRCFVVSRAQFIVGFDAVLALLLSVYSSDAST